MMLSRFLDLITLSLPSATTTQCVERSWPGWLSKHPIIYIIYWNPSIHIIPKLFYLWAVSNLPFFLLRGKWCADCLMIDGLVGQCGEHLTNLWKRDEGGTGQYPPPTLHVSRNLYTAFQLNRLGFCFARISFSAFGSAGPVGHLSTGQHWWSCQTCHCILKWSQLASPNCQYFADQKMFQSYWILLPVWALTCSSRWFTCC